MTKDNYGEKQSNTSKTIKYFMGKDNKKRIDAFSTNKQFYMGRI